MISENRTALRYSIVVSLGGFLFGFDASVISGVVGFVTPEFNLDVWQQGLVVSSPTLAAIVAGLTVGPLSDAIGRRRVLIVVAFLYCLSAALSAVASSFEMLVGARAIGGFAFGSLVLAPLYIAEIAPATIRGAMVSVNQLNIVVGFSAAYFANFALLNLSGSGLEFVVNLSIDDQTWRWMLGLELIPAVGFFLLLFTIPESPRWLLVKNRTTEARSVLGRIMPSESVALVIKDISNSIHATSLQSKSRLRELIKPAMRPLLVVGLIVAIAQQITGVNAVYFFAPTIFEQSGVGTDAAFAQAVWVGIINVVFTIAAMLLIDRIGRKPLMLIGLAGVFLSMSLAAYGFSQATYSLTEASIRELPDLLQPMLQSVSGTVFDSDVAFKSAVGDLIGADLFREYEASLIQLAISANPWIILFGILGFVASFAISLGPVMWVLLSEIFPNHIRGLAISAVTFFNSLVSFVVQFVFPWELNTLGAAWTFMIYGLFAVIGFLLVLKMLPETKNKSLEQLSAEFKSA